MWNNPELKAWRMVQRISQASESDLCGKHDALSFWRDVLKLEV
jgi:hypothetical protein